MEKKEYKCKGMYGYYRHKGDNRVIEYLIVDGNKFWSDEYVQQELDKAREEGREESKREYAQAIATGQKVELTEELVDRIWSANLEEMYKMGLTKLLKTKEDGK
jgi:hypothetical protein